MRRAGRRRSSKCTDATFSEKPLGRGRARTESETGCYVGLIAGRNDRAELEPMCDRVGFYPAVTLKMTLGVVRSCSWRQAAWGRRVAQD